MNNDTNAARISSCSCFSRRLTRTNLLLFIILCLIICSVFFQGVYKHNIQEDIAVYERKNERASTSHSTKHADNNHDKTNYSQSDGAKDAKPSLRLPSDNVNDDIDDDYNVPRSCFVDYRTSLERSADTLELYQKAQLYGFGNCGEKSSNGTSLDRTVAAFAQNPINVSRAKQQKAWFTIEPNRTYAPIYHVTFNFQAYTEYGVPRFLGGDEFILTFKGWTRATIDNVIVDTAFKTAVVARDNHNGSYSATLPIPRGVSLTSYTLTMMHYFTCYQGHTFDRTWSTILPIEYKSVNYGPITVVAHESFSEYLLQTTKDDINSSTIATSVDDADDDDDKLPLCPISQKGIDWYSHGMWVESGIPDQVEITNHALWSPLCCRPPEVLPKPSMLRIGDSTMPQQTMQIGDVYDPTMKTLVPSYNMWIDFLWQLLVEDEESSGVRSDVLVLNSALHFVLLGVVHPTLVPELVIRMVCQLGLVFPGKIMWVGPVPIQEHHFRPNDQKDIDVQYINAVMRDVLQVQSGGKLKQLCSKASILTFETLADPNTGQFISDQESQLKLQESRESVNVTEHREPLLERLERLSANADQLYGNRTVWFAEIDHFLRPRPESYRDKDKIHDMRQVRGKGMLFFTRHKDWIYTLAKFRQLGEA